MPELLKSTVCLLSLLCTAGLVFLDLRVPPMPIDTGEANQPKTYRVAVIAGSMREKSYGRMLAEDLRSLAPESVTLVMVDIRRLPMYNPDVDGKNPPPQWRRFREEVARADAVLFITPEYNRSVPAVIKNAIDVGSKPFGSGALTAKPAAVISFTTGRLGGFGANHHLRQSLVVLNMPVMPTPEAYIAGIDQLIDANGRVKDRDTRLFLEAFLGSFESWISYHHTVRRFE